MDKYRFKEQRYQHYMDMVTGGKAVTQCDLTCAKKCFKDSLGTAWFIYSSCLIPQCNCAQSPLPQSILFQTDPQDQDIIKDNDKLDEDLDDADGSQTDENGEEFEAVITLQNQNGEYNLFRECNLMCHKDCFSIRKQVPFTVLESCVEDRCNCFHNYTLENPPFFCDVKCRDKCVENQRYYWNGEPSLTDCVTQCGCYNQMQ